MKKTTKIILSSVAASFILIGCGGGGGSSSSASATGTVSGSVIDGKIAYAEVCLDLNFNHSCDKGEPNTVTDANGRFSLKYNLNEINSSIAPVLVVPTFQSYDTATGNLFTVKLSSPREGGFVIASPITTLAAEKVYELAKNGNISEQNITTIIQTVTDIINKDVNVSVKNITQTDPSKNDKLLATAVILTDILQNEGNLSGIAEDLNNTNSSLTEAMPKEYRNMYAQVLEAVGDKNNTFHSDELQVILEYAIEQNSTGDLKDIVTENNLTKVYEFVMKGYLDKIYGDLNKSNLSVTSEYNITDWNSSDIARYIVEKDNIINLNELIKTADDQNYTINVDGKSIALNKVMKTYLKLQKVQAVIKKIGKKAMSVSFDDINATAVFDLQTGEPVYFHSDGTYTSASGKKGAWEVFDNVLILDGKQFNVMYGRDNHLMYTDTVEENGTVVSRKLLITKFNKDTNFSEDDIYIMPNRAIWDIYVLNHDIYNHAFKIDGQTFWFAYNGDNYDLYDLNGNKVGTWRLRNNYDYDISYIKVDKSGGKVSYFIILKSITLDNADFYVIKTENNIVKEIKEETSGNIYNFDYLNKFMKEQNKTILSINENDLLNRKFLTDHMDFYKFDKNGTLEITYIDWDNQAHKLSGKWKIIDNKYLEIMTNSWDGNELMYGAVFTNNSNAVILGTLEGNTEKPKQDISTFSLIPTTLESLEINSSKDLVDNFNVKPSLFSFEDINGSVYQTDNDVYYDMYFDSDGNVTVFRKNGQFTRTFKWADDDGVLVLDNNFIYVVPIDYKDGKYDVYLIICQKQDDGSMKIFGITYNSFAKTTFPLKSEMGEFDGYDWYRILAEYPGDNRYIDAYTNINSNNELWLQTSIIHNQISKAEIYTKLNSAHEITASLCRLGNIYQGIKAKVFASTGLNLKTDNNVTVSLYAGLSVNEVDKKVYFWGGEYNGTAYSNRFDAGNCDYNLADNDHNVTLSVSVNGSDQIVYSVTDTKGEQVCSKNYNISDLNLSGTLSFNYAFAGIDINDTDGNASDDSPFFHIKNFEAR